MKITLSPYEAGLASTALTILATRVVQLVKLLEECELDTLTAQALASDVVSATDSIAKATDGEEVTLGRDLPEVVRLALRLYHAKLKAVATSQLKLTVEPTDTQTVMDRVSELLTTLSDQGSLWERLRPTKDSGIDSVTVSVDGTEVAHLAREE